MVVSLKTYYIPDYLQRKNLLTTGEIRKMKMESFLCLSDKIIILTLWRGFTDLVLKRNLFHLASYQFEFNTIQL